MSRSGRRLFRLLFPLFTSLATLAAGDLHAANFTFRGPSGGPRGADFVGLPKGSEIAQVRVHSGKYIDAIEMVYRSRSRSTIFGRKYGGPGGSLGTFNLRAGEYLTVLGGKHGKFIDSIYIQTNLGRKAKWGGSGGHKSFRYATVAGTRIRGVWGRAGKYLDAIGVVVNAPSTSGRGATHRSLAGYANRRPRPPRSKKAPRGQPGDEKADNVGSRNVPRPPRRPDDWLREHNQSLLRIISGLAGPKEYQDLVNRERDQCRGQVNCEVDFRRGAISYALRASP